MEALMLGIGGALLSGSLSDMRPVTVPTSILLAFLGFYPTSKAAHLDPMEGRRMSTHQRK